MTTNVLLASALLVACVDKAEPPPPTAAEQSAALHLPIKAGEIVEISHVEYAARSSYTEFRLPTLRAGQSQIVRVPANAGEVLAAWLVPHRSGGDADLQLSNAEGVVRKTSARDARYVDAIYYEPNCRGTCTYQVRVYCFDGTCAGHTLVISRGDDERFQTNAPALDSNNQRSFPANDSERQNRVTCKIGGKQQAWGECACAASSFADALASLGHIEITNARRTVRDLFENTNIPDYGAADRGRLMNRLESDYEVRCSEITTDVAANLRAALRRGAGVVLRGNFTGSLHYVRAIGWGRDTAGATTVIINDPYGRTVPPSSWSPRNDTTINSRFGHRVEVRFAALFDAKRGDSMIVCD